MKKPAPWNPRACGASPSQHCITFIGGKIVTAYGTLPAPEVGYRFFNGISSPGVGHGYCVVTKVEVNADGFTCVFAEYE